jgi:hypothetical protein
MDRYLVVREKGALKVERLQTLKVLQSCNEIEFPRFPCNKTLGHQYIRFCQNGLHLVLTLVMSIVSGSFPFFGIRMNSQNWAETELNKQSNNLNKDKAFFLVLSIK